MIGSVGLLVQPAGEVATERFTAHYERILSGLAQYVHDAVHANAAGTNAGSSWMHST